MPSTYPKTGAQPSKRDRRASNTTYNREIVMDEIRDLLTRQSQAATRARIALAALKRIDRKLMEKMKFAAGNK